MSTKYRLILGLLFILLSPLTFLYIKFYYVQVGFEKWVFLSPFQADEKDFEVYFEKADYFLKRGDKIKAMQYYKKALAFRGTYNEKQRERGFSDSNLCWEYKIKKAMKYVKAYEVLGDTDEAISSIAPVLVPHEKEYFGVDKKFYELLVTKYGKNKVISLLWGALDSKNKVYIKDINNFQYIYTIKEIAVSIQEEQYKLSAQDKKALFKELCKLYNL